MAEKLMIIGDVNLHTDVDPDEESGTGTTSGAEYVETEQPWGVRITIDPLLNRQAVLTALDALHQHFADEDLWNDIDQDVQKEMERKDQA